MAKIQFFVIICIFFVESQSGEDYENIPMIVSDDESLTLTSSNSTTYIIDSKNRSDFSLFETYLPLFMLILDLPEKDKEKLEDYMKDKTYEKLKYEIDAKVKKYPNTVLNKLNNSIIYNIQTIDQIDEKTTKVVTGYHNASIYNAIRSVWLKQLRPFLPIIDQLAIMQYFSQRKAAEYERMSIWARIWENLSMWMYGRTKNRAVLECYANHPKCVREAMEQLTMEQRIDLDLAADENQFELVDEIIRKKLEENNMTQELDDWLNDNRPPKSLEIILEERTDVEEDALQRLRDNGVLSSLKHYYKAVIESRNLADQEEIRQFVDSMNDTFARCFDPLREQFFSNF
ncbi:unnamed protein product [Caenorhabditis angaria]|uniref:SXP/RAL-2 family protein Ani s 5-like cation-binding domain-containing protein n=1 Tax=Caenorhabditis angaria TaxID=860376 RepID=A0A9P1N0R8_9PELO|nr:unnamed protein product [Caenorhabditis angaria]